MPGALRCGGCTLVHFGAVARLQTKVGVGPARPRTWPELDQVLGPTLCGSGPTCRPTLALVTTVTPVSTTASPSYAESAR